MKKQFEVNVSAFGSANEAAVGADAIFVATTSSAPVVEDSAMTNLRYVCALGANALSRRELDPRSVTRACQIIVDSREVARIEGGTLLPVVENGRVGWQEIVEIGEIVAGNREKITPAPGRYSLFCSHGLAVQDLYTASLLM